MEYKMTQLEYDEIIRELKARIDREQKLQEDIEEIKKELLSLKKIDSDIILQVDSNKSKIERLEEKYQKIEIELGIIKVQNSEIKNLIDTIHKDSRQDKQELMNSYKDLVNYLKENDSKSNAFKSKSFYFYMFIFGTLTIGGYAAIEGIKALFGIMP